MDGPDLDADAGGEAYAPYVGVPGVYGALGVGEAEEYDGPETPL